MDNSDFFIMTNAGKLPQEHIPMIKEKVSELADSSKLSFIKFKEPITTLLLALFLGGYGADQFYLGNNGKGALKLILSILGIISYAIGRSVNFFYIIGLASILVVGIINIIDMIKSYSNTRKKNFLILMQILG